MNQFPNILQYSFCLGKDKYLSSLQAAMNGVSGVFGSEQTENEQASPLQVLTSMTESLAKVVSHALGMHQIGTESLKQLAIEYLSHEVIDLQMALYNFSKQFETHKGEFEMARAQQCKWILQIRDTLDCEGLREQISKLVGEIQEIRFGSQFKLNFPHIYLETSTVFYNKLKNIAELIDLIKSESQLIAKQLYLSLLKQNITIGEFLRLYIIFGCQKHQYQRLLTYASNIKKEDILQELLVISRVFPNLKYHTQQMERILEKLGQIEINFNEEDLQLLMLIKDKLLNTVRTIPENVALPDQFKGLLFFTVQLLSEKNQNHILPQIESILKSDEIRKISWLFSLIAQSIYSTRIKLLLWSYQENVVDQRYITFQQTFIQDIHTLIQLANSADNGVLLKPEKISKRQQLQYQDFIDILHVAAQYDIQQEEGQDVRNKQFQLEQQIVESLSINDLIIQKEPSSLVIRNQLKQYVDILFQTTQLKFETFERLYVYYEQSLVNKQQSLIMVRQQLPQQKSTILDNQKRSQRFLEIQQIILTSDSVIANEQQQNIYPPNFYQCLQIFEKSKQKWKGQSLSRVLQDAQGKYQSQFPLELQNDFVSLLKAIKSYNEEQKEQFRVKLQQLYRKEFQKPLKELAETKQKNILQALQIIQEIELSI